MRRIEFRVRNESWEEQSAARRLHPAMQAVWQAFRKEHSMTLESGRDDAIYGFTEGNDAIFISYNYNLDYCGIQVYDMAAQREESFFLQGHEQLCDVLGPRTLDLAPATIARRMYRHTQECFS